MTTIGRDRLFDDISTCELTLTRIFLLYRLQIFEIIIYINCLFEYPIITHEPLIRFASNFDCVTRENHVNVLIAWFSKLNVTTFVGKIAKNLILNQVRVNDGNTYDYAGFPS